MGWGLSEEQEAKLFAFLNSKNVDHRCLQCRTTADIFRSGFIKIQPEHKEDIGNRVIALTCSNCGFIRFFSADHIGLS